MNVHNGSDKIKCDYCNLKFSWITELYRHYNNFPSHKAGSLQLKCGYCSKKFEKATYLNAHIANIHPDLVYKTQKMQSSETELKPKNNLDLFKCESCWRTYKMIKYLNRHYKYYPLHKINNNKPDHRSKYLFACKLCEKFYKNKFNLQQHSRKHHNVIILPTSTKRNFGYQCLKCENTFSDDLGIKNHMAEKHNNDHQNNKDIDVNDDVNDDVIYNKDVNFDKLPTCKYCHQTYLNEQNLKRHYRRYPDHVNATKPLDYYHKCSICSRTFRELIYLNRHINIDHKKLQFKCKLCNSNFSRKPLLMVHMKKSHKGVTLHICNYCNKTYPSLLQIHSHYKQNPSHKATSTISKSKNVSKNCSSNKMTLRLFKCKLCPKVYTSIIEMNNHQQKHSNKPIKQSGSNSHNAVNMKNDEDEFSVDVEFDSEDDYDKDHDYDDDNNLAKPSNYNKNVGKNKQIAEKTIEMKQKTFSCNMCDKKFQQQSILTLHKKTHQHQNISLNCLKCNKSYSVTTIFEQHLSLHNDSKMKKKFNCNICDSQYSNSILLKSHKAVHQYFQCDLCHKVFENKPNLQQHATLCLKEFSATFLAKLK